MKIIKIIFLSLVSNLVFCQETIISASFPVRDFFFAKDTLNFIEKRDVVFSPQNSISNYFIGGYGLKIFDDSDNNEIITVSNELLSPVCSLRFFNKSTKTVEEVYYYQKARAIDAILLDESKSVAISLKNNKIQIVNYSKKPEFLVTHEIKLNSISRKLLYRNKKLYYCTDFGEVYSYDFTTKENTLLLSTNKIITDFSISGDVIFYFTIDGEIAKRDLKTLTFNKISINENFVLNSIQINNDKLILGTFNGTILILNKNKFQIEKELKYHARSVLKIYQVKENEFFSSSIDKTIKKWKLN